MSTPKIIPKKFVDFAEKAREHLSQSGAMGVVINLRRGAGRTMLQNMISAQDAEVLEIKTVSQTENKP